MNRSLVAGAALLIIAPLVLAKERQVEDFNAVTYALPFEVEFVAADSPYVRLEGDEDTIDEIVTVVDAGTLKIYKEDTWFDFSDEEVLVTVGYTQLSSLSMSGSGDGYAEDLESDEMTLKVAGSANMEIDRLSCNDLLISIAGSGDIHLNELEADTMQTKIAGSGSVEVIGRVVSQKISIAGSGDHIARELRSQEAEVSVAGSGDVEVWAMASLNAKVVGSGDIAYYGTPKVHEQIIGSGDLQHRGDEP